VCFSGGKRVSSSAGVILGLSRWGDGFFQKGAASLGRHRKDSDVGGEKALAGGPSRAQAALLPHFSHSHNPKRDTLGAWPPECFGQNLTNSPGPLRPEGDGLRRSARSAQETQKQSIRKTYKKAPCCQDRGRLWKNSKVGYSSAVIFRAVGAGRPGATL
jgi:hypothetical protein